MKKYFALFVAMIMILACFAACGKTETPSGEEVDDSAINIPSSAINSTAIDSNAIDSSAVGSGAVESGAIASGAVASNGIQ